MNTKTTIILLVVLLIIVSIFSYNRGVQKGMIKSTTSVATSTVQNTLNNTWIPEASFACKDNSHFIAQFPNENTLGILVDGKLVRTLPHVMGDGQRFEDSSYVYVFAGEEVVVTNKTVKKTTTCEQPRDPNNAPMNFGDAGEGEAGFITQNQGGTNNNTNNVAPDVSLIVKENIVGTWKSTEDVKFVREFTNKGVVTDIYDGKIVTTGTWHVYTNEKPLKVSFPLEKGLVYLQLADNEDKTVIFNFKVTKITPENLELIYVEHGGVNAFTRVK